MSTARLGRSPGRFGTLHINVTSFVRLLIWTLNAYTIPTLITF